MIRELVAVCVALAENAGEAIRRISTDEDLKIVNKADGQVGQFDPQTEADRVAEMIIVTALRSNYPNCTIIGEEEVSTGLTSLSIDHNEFLNQQLIPSRDVLEKCTQLPPTYDNITQEDLIVWLDPLDGTSDFAAGMREHVTVLIGIALKSGEPIAGVIHQPFHVNANSTTTGRTVWGIVGVGAFNLEDLSSEKLGHFVVATSKTHVDGVVLSTVTNLGADKIMHTPGAGFKAIELLEKRVDAFVYPGKGTSKWDICATDAVCRSMFPPLIVTDFFGNPFDYSMQAPIKNSHGIIVTCESLYKSLLAKIPQHTLDYLK